MHMNTPIPTPSSMFLLTRSKKHCGLSSTGVNYYQHVSYSFMVLHAQCVTPHYTPCNHVHTRFLHTGAHPPHARTRMHTHAHTHTPHIWIKDYIYYVKIVLPHLYTQARTCIAHTCTQTHTHTHTHMYMITYTHTHAHMYMPFTTKSAMSHLDNTDHLQTTHCLGKLKLFCTEYILRILAVLSHHFIDLLVSSCKKKHQNGDRTSHTCTCHHQCIRDINKNIRKYVDLSYTKGSFSLLSVPGLPNQDHNHLFR